MTGPAFYRDLWGPRYDPHGRYPMSGDDIVAVKRVVSRAGYLAWGEFSNTYGDNAEAAVKRFQVDAGIANPSGHYGKPTHDALRQAGRNGYPGEPAWDAYSTQIYSEAIVDPKPAAAFKRDLWGPSYDPYKRYPMSGDDALAVKRALSRAGFIGWQDFTNVYGTQAEDGCQAFQKTVGIQGEGGGPPKGHYGQKTHDALLATMADGKHEWAFDAYSLELYRNANPPATATSGTVRQQALQEATKYIGVTESPSGSNNNQFGAWYGMDGDPWCAIFVTYAYETGAKGGSPSFAKGSYYSYVPYIVSDARNGRRGLAATPSPVPGDLVCYDWARDGTFDHMGIFESGSSSSWKAVEGNTSTSNNSNGGQVMRRSRSSSDADVVFVRVAEP